MIIRYVTFLSTQGTNNILKCVQRVRKHPVYSRYRIRKMFLEIFKSEEIFEIYICCVIRQILNKPGQQ